ncbi:alpha/beta fold hydrolase [Amycolatopsis sp. lyj-23]|uniref:alpha/beta fold hydrolase n=1 Tax=Amycolatopsis sp. lyj-23 TaxID=2789283 RepID=UPI0039781F22
MLVPPRTRRRGLCAGGLAVLAVLLATVGLAGCARPNAASAATQPSPTATSSSTKSRPTVVLVHGAFADASSWSGVVTRLQKQGYPVVAPALGLRGLAADSAYLASLLGQIKGPVVLVGHSYGGAVISTAATKATNVRALVYVNAFATDTAEVLSTVEKNSADSALNPALQQFTYPTGRTTPRSSPRSSPAICPMNRPRYWPPPNSRPRRRRFPMLKNAIDFLHREWADKAVSFLSYGGIGAGTRAVQQLKQVVTTLRMVPIFESINVPFAMQKLTTGGEVASDPPMEEAATVMLDELLRVTKSLRPAFRDPRGR